MKGKLLKVLSLAMALTLVASLAACGGSSDEETTTSAENTTIGDVVPGDDVSADGETPADESTEPATDANGNTVAPPATQKPGEPTKAPGNGGNGGNGGGNTAVVAPKNAAEAMKLYNDSLGKTSISGKMTSISLDKANAGAFKLKELDGRIEPTFKSETTKKFNNKLFPLNNATLKSAKVQGDNVVMSFTLAPLNNVNAAYGQNGFMYFVTQAEGKATVTTVINVIGEAAQKLKIQVKSIDSIALTGTFDVTVNAKTGKLVSATYKFTENLKGKASYILGNLNVDIVGSGTCTYTGK